MKFNIGFALGLSYCSAAAYGLGHYICISKDILCQNESKIYIDCRIAQKFSIFQNSIKAHHFISKVIGGRCLKKS